MGYIHFKIHVEPLIRIYGSNLIGINIQCMLMSAVPYYLSVWSLGCTSFHCQRCLIGGDRVVIGDKNVILGEIFFTTAYKTVNNLSSRRRINLSSWLSRAGCRRGV